MDKKILAQYADLQQEVKEVREKVAKLEAQIDKIESEGAVIDKVMGGEGGLQPFKVEGFPYPEYSRKKTLLYARKSTLVALEMELLEVVNQVEQYITTIDDSHIRRIVSFRVVDGLSWGKVAQKMGGGNTEDSVRKAFDRYVS